MHFMGQFYSTANKFYNIKEKLCTNFNIFNDPFMFYICFVDVP